MSNSSVEKIENNSNQWVDMSKESENDKSLKDILKWTVASIRNKINFYDKDMTDNKTAVA